MADHGEIENLERRVAELEVALAGTRERANQMRCRVEGLSEILRLLFREEDFQLEPHLLPDEADGEEDDDAMKDWDLRVEQVGDAVARRRPINPPKAEYP